MNKLMTALVAGLFIIGIQSQAFAASEKQIAQRAKMKSCNAEAKTKALRGAERKAFIKDCLSADGAPAAIAAPAAAAPAAAAPATDGKTMQQEKMKTCNADAKSKELKGDDRRMFMKDCLSAK